MVFVHVAFHVTGDTFSPATAEKKTGLSFNRKSEIGEMGSIGIHKGKTIPYGSAELRPPFEHVYSDHEHTPYCDFGLHWIAEVLEQHATTLVSCGADPEQMYVSLGVFYQDQCNLSISPEAMRKIGVCGIPLYISCYEQDDLIRSIENWKRDDEAKKDHGE